MIEATPKNTIIPCIKHNAMESKPCIKSGHPNTPRFPGHVCGSRFRKTRHM